MAPEVLETHWTDTPGHEPALGEHHQGKSMDKQIDTGTVTKIDTNVD